MTETTGTFRVEVHPAAPVGGMAVRAMAAVLGYAGLAVALVFMSTLHWVAPDEVDPVRTVMSNYALVDGVGWKLGVSLAGGAVAAAGATLGLVSRGLLSTPLVRVAMGLTVISALVAGAFTTDEEFPLSLSGEIHRFAAVTLFVCVPIAGMLVAGRLTNHPELAGYRGRLLLSAWLAAGLATVFLLSHLAVAPEGLRDLRGLFQRLMMIAELLVLAQLVVLPHQRFRGARKLRH